MFYILVQHVLLQMYAIICTDHGIGFVFLPRPLPPGVQHTTSDLKAISQWMTTTNHGASPTPCLPENSYQDPCDCLQGRVNGSTLHQDTL